MTPAALRSTTVLLACACAIFWLIVAHASIGDKLVLAKGVHIARYTTVVFLLAVWPALILAICNVALRAALGLAVVAAAVYGSIALAYLPMAIPTNTVSLLLALLAAILGGTYWMFGMPIEAEGERPFEPARFRLIVLYVAGLGMVVWLSSFEPIIRLSGDPRADGFHAIPAFYATLLYLPLVISLLVIGLRGTHGRNADLVGGMTVVTLAISAIFGFPQLVS